MSASRNFEAEAVTPLILGAEIRTSVVIVILVFLMLVIMLGTQCKLENYAVA